jgi:hypothetical protein
METKAGSKRIKMPGAGKALPMFQDFCSFEGYNAERLMMETGKLRELITCYNYTQDTLSSEGL